MDKLFIYKLSVKIAANQKDTEKFRLLTTKYTAEEKKKTYLMRDVGGLRIIRLNKDQLLQVETKLITHDYRFTSYFVHCTEEQLEEAKKLLLNHIKEEIDIRLQAANKMQAIFMKGFEEKIKVL